MKNNILVPDFISMINQSEIENAFFGCYDDINCFKSEKGLIDAPVIDTEKYNTVFSSGSNLYRGYFCPSPVEDIVIGKTKRGKLTKKLSKRGNSKKYLFNENNELIAVLGYTDEKHNSTEAIINSGNIEHGVYYFNDMLTIFCECIYNENGQIIMYTKCILYPFKDIKRDANPITEINQQKYEYKDGLLVRCTMRDVVASPFEKRLIIGGNREYCFDSDKGKYKAYTCNGTPYKSCTDRAADAFTQRPVFRE